MHHMGGGRSPSKIGFKSCAEVMHLQMCRKVLWKARRLGALPDMPASVPGIHLG